MKNSPFSLNYTSYINSHLTFATTFSPNTLLKRLWSVADETVILQVFCKKICGVISVSEK
jgi:hypothetical protein